MAIYRVNHLGVPKSLLEVFNKPRRLSGFLKALEWHEPITPYLTMVPKLFDVRTGVMMTEPSLYIGLLIYLAECECLPVSL